jgi:hypothetical protein
VLELYSELGQISAACRGAGVHRTTHYVWLKADPGYKAAFEEAEEKAGDAPEEAARRRALEGSDTLLIFLLKGSKPDKYKERSEQNVILNGGFEHRLVVARERVRPGAGKEETSAK